MRLAAYIGILLSYLFYGFIAIYYNFIDQSHVGTMDWWAIFLLILATVNIFIALYILYKKPTNDKEDKKAHKILKHIVRFPVYLLLLPLSVVFIVIYLLVTISQSVYVLSKPLRKKGFEFKRKRKPYSALLIKENVVIKFAYVDYKISFDNGKTFIDIVDSNLGTSEERDLLRTKTIEYITAASLSKQKGDVVEPIGYFIEFLNKYL